MHMRAAEGLFFRYRAIRWQIDLFRGIGKLLTPVIGGIGPVLFGLPMGEILIRDRKLRQGSVPFMDNGVIKRAKFIDQDARRPAIADNMMGHQDHQAFICRHLDHTPADQGRLVKDDRCCGFKPCQAKGFAGRIAMTGKIIKRDGRRRGGVDFLRDRAVLFGKARAQCFMTVHQTGQGGLQDIGPQITGAAEDIKHAIGTAVAVHL